MSIANRARDAEASFESWRAMFEAGTPEVEEAENQLFRFNLWTSNNFVFEAPRASMDWRLRNASLLRSTMEDLLDDLNTNLSAHDTGSFVVQNITQPEVIQETLDQLFRFSRAVRRSGILHRFVKIADYVEYSPDGINLTEEFRKAATQLVGYHLKGSPGGQALKDRLIETICLRQQNFAYLKARRDRHTQRPLATHDVLPPAPSRSVLTTSFSIGGPLPANAKKKKAEITETPRRLGHSVMTATTVQYDITPVTHSVQSSVNNQQPEVVDADANLPQPPDVPVGQREWECPYCLLVCPVKELSGEPWRKHILGDVMPYICVLETCPTPNTLFASSKDWARHMKTEHVSLARWTCMDSNHEAPCFFESESRFKSHMHEAHADQFDDSDLEDLAETCFESKPGNLNLTECPFRVENCPARLEPGEILPHVAQHLLSFSRISLEGYTEENIDGSDISRAIDETDQSWNQLVSMTVADGLKMDMKEFLGDEGDDLESLATISALEIPEETENETWEFFSGPKDLPEENQILGPARRNLRTRLHIDADEIMRRDWVSYHHVPPELLESWPRKEIERQNNLHEIVATECSYLLQLHVIGAVYRDGLRNSNPPILATEPLDTLTLNLFDKVEAIKTINQEILFDQLVHCQREQGPFISGFSDIFRNWITNAQDAYMSYSASYPHARSLFRSEYEINPEFRLFLKQARENRYSNRLSWDTYLKSPIARISQYVILLNTVNKNTVEDSEEKRCLSLAISEMRAFKAECEKKMDEVQKRVGVIELSTKLHIPPNIHADADLHNPKREVIFQGLLQRKDTQNARWPFKRWVHMHGALLDNCLLLTDTVMTQSYLQKPKLKGYQTTDTFVPIDLLEVKDGDAIPEEKSTRHDWMSNLSLKRFKGGDKTNSNLLEDLDNDREGLLYSFTIKRLGGPEAYILFAPSDTDRKSWLSKIIQAKVRRAALLASVHAEPFKVNVQSSMIYPVLEAGSTTPTTKGSPLDHALRIFGSGNLDSTTYYASHYTTVINCAITLRSETGQSMCMIGTNYGVYASRYQSLTEKPLKVLDGRVTQIHALEDRNVLVLIFLADKSVITHVVNAMGPLAPRIIAAWVESGSPRNISWDEDVESFVVVSYEGRPTVIFKTESDNFYSVPAIRHFDDPQDSPKRLQVNTQGKPFHMSWMESSLVMTTSIGIERFPHALSGDSTHGGYIEDVVKYLDNPWGESYLNQKQVRPLGMFRLPELGSFLAGSSYLVAFNVFAIYLKDDFTMSSVPLLKFAAKADNACLVGKFLVLFHEDFVEVRDVLDGSLRQVISGRRIKCLNTEIQDYQYRGRTKLRSAAQETSGQSSGHGHRGEGPSLSVKMAMEHPGDKASQIVLELVPKEDPSDPGSDARFVNPGALSARFSMPPTIQGASSYLGHLQI